MEQTTETFHKTAGQDNSQRYILNPAINTTNR